MIVSKLESSPEKKIPVAMALIAVGLSMTAIGISWSRFAPSVPHSGSDWNDFFRGAIFGVAIVLEIAGVAIAASAAAVKKRQAQ
ncbi:MAG: hypothetical protein WDM87_17475 [Terracidiphilus sp.]